MKRLSDITSDIVNDLYENSDWYGDYSLIEAAINRLAAYEDTGLEPEGVVHLAECWQQEHETLCQYLALGSIDRLRELAQAHKECISPCTFCRFNPPSSGDGKPCCMCPAVAALRREQDG